MIIYIYYIYIYILLYTVIVVHRTLILPMFSAITNFNTRIISWAAQSRPGSWYVASSATESSTRCLGRQRRRKRRFEIVGNTMGNILNWLIQQLWRMDKDGPCADDLQMNSLFNTAIFQGYLSWLRVRRYTLVAAVGASRCPMDLYRTLPRPTSRPSYLTT